MSEFYDVIKQCFSTFSDALLRSVISLSLSTYVYKTHGKLHFVWIDNNILPFRNSSLFRHKIYTSLMRCLIFQPMITSMWCAFGEVRQTPDYTFHSPSFSSFDSRTIFIHEKIAHTQRHVEPFPPFHSQAYIHTFEKVYDEDFKWSKKHQYIKKANFLFWALILGVKLCGVEPSFIKTLFYAKIKSFVNWFFMDFLVKKAKSSSKPKNS